MCPCTCWWRPAALASPALQLRPSHLCLRPHTAVFPLCVYICVSKLSPFKDTVIGLQPTLTQHDLILNPPPSEGTSMGSA